MKKYKKLLINIMVIFIILFNLFIPNAYAGPLQDIMNRAEGFVNNGENGGNVINNDALKCFISNRNCSSIHMGNCIRNTICNRKPRRKGRCKEKFDCICNWMYHNIWSVWNLEIATSIVTTTCIIK